MDASEFSSRLSQVEANPAKIAELARQLAEDVRHPAREAIAHYLLAEGPARDKGKVLLNALAEFALLPLAGSASLSDAATEVWVIRALCKKLVSFRLRAATAVRPLLANRQPFPVPRPGSPQAPVAASRPCDLAFVVLQRMICGRMSSSQFLGLSSDARDQQIDNFQKSARFQQFFDSQL